MFIFFNNFKYFFIERIKRNPYLWAFSVNYLSKFDILLPHEKCYWGLIYLFDDLKNGLILDVGANNGLSALGFKKIGFDFSIFSVEADPSHISNLKKIKSKFSNFRYKIVGASNKADNLEVFTPFYKNIALHCLTSADSDFVKKSVKRDYSKSIASHIKYKSFKIKLIPLDNLNLKPDIIKIDVEGFDALVVEGLLHTIQRFKPVLLIEFSPLTFLSISRILKPLNYKFFVFVNKNNSFMKFDRKKALNDFNKEGLQVNFFCLPRDKVNYIKINKHFLS